MAFASLDLLAVVKASFCSTHLRGLHRLTIQTPRRRMFVPFLAFSDAGAYRIMHADPHTGAFPGSEVMIDTLPLGEIDRQHAPLDAPFRHIKDGIEHRAHTQGARSSTTFGGGNQIFDPLPFLVSEVAWIYFFVHLHILHNLRRLFRQALKALVSHKLCKAFWAHLSPLIQVFHPHLRRWNLRGVDFSSGRAGIAAGIRYAFGTPSRSKRRETPDAMPSRQH